MPDIMTLKTNFETAMKSCQIVAILRGITVEEVPDVCAILAQHNIKLLEIPLNTPNAPACIKRAVECAADGQMVGAGTVLTPQDVDDVQASGGQFIISPNTSEAVIRRTKECGMLSIPGCFTATECFTAQFAGADYIKLFPAGALGAGYIRDLQAVVKLPFMAVGGVHAGNIPDFLQCCCAVGIGSALYKPGRTLDEIRDAAAKLVRSLTA